MPRSSRRSAPARSAPAPARAAPAPAPAPQRHAQPAPVPAQQQYHSNVPAHVPQQGPGIMGQIAANAASIAVGSTIARGVSGALFGHGSSEAQTVQAPQEVAQQQPYQQQAANSCEPIAKDFANCLTATGNDMSACQYYLEQFKACQAAAAPY